MAEEKWFEGEVTRIVDATDNTKQFFFKLPHTDNFEFKPGQFITMDLPIHEKKNKRWRSYSIASNPNGTNEFELVISYVPDGLGTNYLWKNISEGSKILMRGPLGVFTLPETLEEDICFICTGTGIAPFRSMSKWMAAHPEFKRRNVYLLFGCRTEKDLLYPEELLSLQHKMENFTYVRCCSRENPETFKGHVGYVHPVYEKLFEDKRPVKFYLCGWRNMIDEAKQRITALGYDRKAIHVEIYG